MNSTSLKTAAKVFPWALSFVLAITVWHDHSRSLIPWLIATSTCLRLGWSLGRARRAPRRTGYRTGRGIASVIVLPEPELSAQQRRAQHAVMASLDRTAYVVGFGPSSS